jgi:hypothetical protein
MCEKGKEKKKKMVRLTVIAELLDIPHQVFVFVRVLLFIWILAQKVCALRFFVNADGYEARNKDAPSSVAGGPAVASAVAAEPLLLVPGGCPA